MNFKDFLFLFINDPSKLGELVRSIYYDQSKIVINQFQEELKKIINEDENDTDPENTFQFKIHKYVTSEERLKDLNPQLAVFQSEFTQYLDRVYSAYKLIKPITEIGSNSDIFGTQYISKEIPITEQDKTRTKIIGLETEHKCLICQTNLYTKVFKQIVHIDFLNNKITSNSYFQCQKCNNLTIDSL